MTSTCPRGRGAWPGARARGAIESAIDYVESGEFDDVPNTIHGRAFHLLGLLVANHPFVDGNERTATNTVVAFYFLNGYRFSYDEEVEDVLKHREINRSKDRK